MTQFPSLPLPPCVCVNIQEGSTLAQCSSEEALEVCSDTEAPNAFQRDGPGRVSIKKGTCRPTGVPCEPFFCTSQGGSVQYVTFTTAPLHPPPPGKGAPKSLPNVEVQNAEPKMEEDESSIPDYGEVMIVVWCTPPPAASGPDVLMYVCMCSVCSPLIRILS